MNQQSVSIFSGRVAHCRLFPRLHKFSYPMVLFSFDLKKLESINKYWPFIAYNRMALFSIHDSDYLQKQDGSILDKLLNILSGESKPAESKTGELKIDESKISENIINHLKKEDLTDDSTINLFTMPRVLNYVFNPVSFYQICEKKDDTNLFVAEVNNTFGEKHLYLQRSDSQENSGLKLDTYFSKDFYVSPFLPLTGKYRFLVEISETNLNVEIILEQAGTKTFFAKLVAKKHSTSMLKFFLCKPWLVFAILLPMTWIHFQALYVYFCREATYYKKKSALSENTIRIEPGLFANIRLKILSLFKRCSV